METTVLYGLQEWSLSDIAKVSDLSIEELSCLSYSELWNIIDDAFERYYGQYDE